MTEATNSKRQKTIRRGGTNKKQLSDND